MEHFSHPNYGTAGIAVPLASLLTPSFQASFRVAYSKNKALVRDILWIARSSVQTFLRISTHSLSGRVAPLESIKWLPTAPAKDLDKLFSFLPLAPALQQRFMPPQTPLIILSMKSVSDWLALLCLHNMLAAVTSSYLHYQESLGCERKF